MAASPTLARSRRRPDQLSGGRHGLTAAEVATSQRTRIIAAMTTAVGEHGYHGVRVADVVWRAGVSRKTFYELFSGKDECFTATFEHWIDQLLTTSFEAFEAQAAWIDRLRAAITALLSTLAGLPAAARLCFVEAPTVGGSAAERCEECLAHFEPLFEFSGAPSGQLGATLCTGRVSELRETLRREILAGRTEQLPALAPQLMCALALPFLGIEAAQRELERPSKA